MAERLTGKRIFRTGAAQGIGLAIAQSYLREDAALFPVDLDADRLAQSVAALDAPGRVGWAAADISDRPGIEAATEKAAAGTGPRGDNGAASRRPHCHARGNRHGGGLHYVG